MAPRTALHTALTPITPPATARLPPVLIGAPVTQIPSRQGPSRVSTADAMYVFRLNPAPIPIELRLTSMEGLKTSCSQPDGACHEASAQCHAEQQDKLRTQYKHDSSMFLS